MDEGGARVGSSRVLSPTGRTERLPRKVVTQCALGTACEKRGEQIGKNTRTRKRQPSRCELTQSVFQTTGQSFLGPISSEEGTKRCVLTPRVYIPDPSRNQFCCLMSAACLAHATTTRNPPTFLPKLNSTFALLYLPAYRLLGTKVKSSLTSSSDSPPHKSHEFHHVTPSGNAYMLHTQRQRQRERSVGDTQLCPPTHASTHSRDSGNSYGNI